MGSDSSRNLESACRTCGYMENFNALHEPTATTFAPSPGLHRPLINPSVRKIRLTCEKRLLGEGEAAPCATCHRSLITSSGLNNAVDVPAEKPIANKFNLASESDDEEEEEERIFSDDSDKEKRKKTLFERRE